MASADRTERPEDEAELLVWANSEVLEPIAKTARLLKAATRWREEVRRNINRGHHLWEPFQPNWPMLTPFIYKQFLVQIIQQSDSIHAHLHCPEHGRAPRAPERPPSRAAHSLLVWDSVGYYEGDTLVIGTVGVKTDRPYALIELFGAPYTKSLHIIERYRHHRG